MNNVKLLGHGEPEITTPVMILPTGIPPQTTTTTTTATTSHFTHPIPKKTIDNKSKNKLSRVSIKFKVNPTWRGSINRDFPGRMFNFRNRQVLQEWAEQFRNGVSLYQTALEEDARIVNLPEGITTRRKPFLGVNYTDRIKSYHWFRSTHNRLLTNNSISLLPANKSSSSSSSSSTTTTTTTSGK